MTVNIQQQSKIAKSTILAKLTKQVSGADYTKLPIEQGYQYPEISQQAHIDKFVSLLEANHAQVIKLDETNIANVVSKELENRGISTLLYGKNARYCDQIIKIEPGIKAQAFDFSLTKKQQYKDKLFNDTPASITSSHSAIAATGSIVLWPTINEPRTLSLVPPVHFVIVDATSLHSDFASLISAQQWQNNLPTNVVLVSGPSKTADIQQTLAYGAHGPKELIVLLLNS
ncbi:MAG: lactate utilization protein [Litorilituus sp.]|jgi:L-lactate dehydrogenase complex protein LldG|nr:lactate utilization protein [Litorilituus sp.]